MWFECQRCPNVITTSFMTRILRYIVHENPCVKQRLAMRLNAHLLQSICEVLGLEVWKGSILNDRKYWFYVRFLTSLSNLVPAASQRLVLTQFSFVNRVYGENHLVSIIHFKQLIPKLLFLRWTQISLQLDFKLGKCPDDSILLHWL